MQPQLSSYHISHGLSPNDSPPKLPRSYSQSTMFTLTPTVSHLQFVESSDIQLMTSKLASNAPQSNWALNERRRGKSAQRAKLRGSILGILSLIARRSGLELRLLIWKTLLQRLRLYQVDQGCLMIHVFNSFKILTTYPLFCLRFTICCYRPRHAFPSPHLTPSRPAFVLCLIPCNITAS